MLLDKGWHEAFSDFLFSSHNSFFSWLLSNQPSYSAWGHLHSQPLTLPHMVLPGQPTPSGPVGHCFFMFATHTIPALFHTLHGSQSRGWEMKRCCCHVGRRCGCTPAHTEEWSSQAPLWAISQQIATRHAWHQDLVGLKKCLLLPGDHLPICYFTGRSFQP